LETASAVNKVFMMAFSCSAAWSGEVFGGAAQWLTEQ